MGDWVDHVLAHSPGTKGDWIQLLLGPAVIVAILGWAYQRFSENRLRKEKVSDFHDALIAEISVNCRRYAGLDMDKHLAMMRKRMRDDVKFIPFVPKQSTSTVYIRITAEIHIIEGEAIEQVVDYYFRENQIDALVEDLRSEKFVALDIERRVQMYTRYIQLTQSAFKAGGLARQALRENHPGRRSKAIWALRKRWFWQRSKWTLAFVARGLPETTGSALQRWFRQIRLKPTQKRLLLKKKRERSNRRSAPDQ